MQSYAVLYPLAVICYLAIFDIASFSILNLSINGALTSVLEVYSFVANADTVKILQVY
jgi:hypothetical protein